MTRVKWHLGCALRLLALRFPNWAMAPAELMLANRCILSGRKATSVAAGSSAEHRAGWGLTHAKPHASATTQPSPPWGRGWTATALSPASAGRVRGSSRFERGVQTARRSGIRVFSRSHRRHVPYSTVRQPVGGRACRPTYRNSGVLILSAFFIVVRPLRRRASRPRLAIGFRGSRMYVIGGSRAENGNAE